MNYELAKELKDAGFPQFTKEKSPLNHSECYDRGLDGTTVFIPTLSELIEACEPRAADDFVLSIELDGWEARIMFGGYTEGWPRIKRDSDDEFIHFDIKAFGSTPEEAVARLWLALNKP